MSAFSAGGSVRITTNPRVFSPATPLAEALGQATQLREHPGVVTLNLVTDAQHAAVAIEQDATWVSKDRDCARFRELRWRPPRDEP